MNEYLQSQRDYDAAEKFRCVARATIFPESIKDQIRKKYFPSMPPRVFEKYWRSRTGPALSEAESAAAIAKNIKYLFTEKIPPFGPGRFNDEHFAALYTAKTPAIAQTERLHYADGDKPFDYVIYSLRASGNVADIRPLQEAKEIELTDNHEHCRLIAAEIRDHCAGVAWYSVRHKGGSCCAFFSVDSINPGVIVREATSVRGTEKA